MPESPPCVDEATLYVLGLLGGRERRKFEARLKNSSELRALVRALETGAVALTMAAPRRDPPTKIWEGIQSAIAHETQRPTAASAFGSAWMRTAIAACVIFGWFAYVFWFNRSAVPDGRSEVAVREPAEDPEDEQMRHAPDTAHVVPQSVTTRQTPRQRSASARKPVVSKSGTVQQRIAELESQLAHLSQAMTQQQVLPPEFSRITFFNFGSGVSDGGAGATSEMPAPSPELRRALLLALARQWGWLPSLEKNQQGTQGTPQQKPQEASPPATQVESGVEFVDLPPVASDPPPSQQTTSVQAPANPEPSSTPETSSLLTASEPSSLSSTSETSASSSGSVPGFVDGTKLVFAVDSSLVPSGTETVFVYSSENGQATRLRGTLVVGPTPTVVTVPLQVGAWNNRGTATFSGTSGLTGLVLFRITVPAPTPPPPDAP